MKMLPHKLKVAMAEEIHRDIATTFKFFKEQPFGWLDPTTNKQVPLRVVNNTPASIRRVNRLLGLLWSKLVAHMRGNGSLRQGLRLGSNGFKGRLWLVNADEEEITEMFHVISDDKKQLMVLPHFENLARHAQVPELEAKKWAEALE